MKYFSVMIAFFTLAFGCSNFTPSANFAPKQGASNAVVSDKDYLEGLDSFPTTLTGEKFINEGGDIGINAKINFPVRVIDLKEEDIIVINGFIKKDSFSRIDDRNFALIVRPEEFGDVSIQVPAGVAAAFVSSNKKNDASDKLTKNFTDYELDETIKLQSFDVANRDSSVPTKLVMIIDDSQSRAGDQNRIAENLKKTLNDLKGKNVDIYAYSTTLFNKSNTTSGYIGRYTGKLPNSHTGGKLLTNSDGYEADSRYPALSKQTYFMNNGVETLFTKSPLMLFDHQSIEERFSIGPSVLGQLSGLGQIYIAQRRKAIADFYNGLNERYNTNYDQSALDDLLARDQALDHEEFAINNIYSKVLNFGESGSTEEKPLCTLMSLILNEGEHKIFTEDGEGDKVAFMIITDEDQQDINCPHTFTGDVTQTAAKEAAEYVNTHIYPYRKGVYLDYDKKGEKNDDDTYPSARANGQRLVNGSTNCTTGVESDCYSLNSGQEGECTDTEREAAVNKISNTLHPDGQVYRCYVKRYVHATASKNLFSLKYETGVNKTSTTFTVKERDGTVKTITDKSLFEYSKEKHALGADVIFNGNIHVPVPAAVPAGYRMAENAKINMIPGLAEAGFKALIDSKAKALFSSYSITAISNLGAANPTNCTDENKVSTVINELAGNRTISICENDYSAIFDWFSQFATKEPQPEYQLSSNVKEVLSIKLSDRDNALTPANFTFINGKLTFTNTGVLNIGNGQKFEIKYREE